MGCQETNCVHNCVYEVVRCTNIQIKYNFVVGKITVSGSPFNPEVLDSTSLVYCIECVQNKYNLQYYACGI
jgi:hypothetical protein